MRNWFDGLKGGVGLVIYLAVIAAVGFAIWKYGWPKVQEMMNSSGQASVPAEGGD